MIDGLMTGECNYILTDFGSMIKAVNFGKCSTLVQTGSEFMTRSMGFVVPRNWSYTAKLSKAILDIKAAHLEPTFQEYAEQFNTCPRSEDFKITFERLKVFFYVSFGICTFLFIFMIIDPQKPLGQPLKKDVDRRTTDNTKSPNNLRDVHKASTSELE